jgi:hypothetical protein
MYRSSSLEFAEKYVCQLARLVYRFGALRRVQLTSTLAIHPIRKRAGDLLKAKTRRGP